LAYCSDFDFENAYGQRDGGQLRFVSLSIAQNAIGNNNHLRPIFTMMVFWGWWGKVIQ